MNYWIATTEFISDSTDGISTYVKHHAGIFAAKGHKVLIIQGSVNGEAQTTGVSTNINLHRFSLQGRKSGEFLGHDAALSFEFANEIIKLLASNTPDVIEIQEYLGIGYYLLMRKYLGEPLLKNIPVVVTAHMPSFIKLEYEHVSSYKFPEYWTGEMEKFSLLAADMAISPSRYLVQLLRERMTEAFPKKVLNIPYPLPLITTQATQISRGTFLVLGEMSYSKGTFNLLEAAHLLWNNGMEFRIIWIGNSETLIATEGETIGNLVRNKYSNHINTGKLSLIGKLPGPEIISHLSLAHAVIIPSVVDNLPYMAIMAMAAGKVVLTSSSGGQAELLSDGTTGFIFDWNKPGSFEEKLGIVLSLDNVILESIGINAKETVKICSSENYYSLKFDAITDLIQSYEPKKLFPVIRPQARQKKLAPISWKQGLEVVIPYFNMGNYIDDCLESVFTSSYKNIQVTIVDDGSTEELSISKLRAIEQNYPHLKIIHQENAGLSEARNTGLKKANLKYIMFLDADDTVHSDYFNRCITILEQYENISFVSCWLKYFEAANGIWPAQNPEVPYLLFHNTVHSGSIFKTEDILQTGGYDKSFLYGMEDYEMAVHLVSKGFHGVTIPEGLYNYRIRKQSMARAFTVNKNIYLYTLISEKHKSLFIKYGPESINILNANGPGYLHNNPTTASRFMTKTVAPKSTIRAIAEILVNKYPKLQVLARGFARLKRR